MQHADYDRILLVDKPAGITSFELVKKIKRGCKIKKIGHAGTLDRLASGLMILATGHATKLLRYFMDQDKVYETEFLLGVTTDTCDMDGIVTEKKPVTSEHFDKLDQVLKKFTGTIDQTPPVYSAVKINGKRASDRVRDGEQIEIKARRITLFSIDVLEVNTDSARVKLSVACSKGTYIRSLARDVGKELGCGASVSGIRRTESGGFSVDNALRSEDVDLTKQGPACLSMGDALAFMSSISVDEKAERKVLNGVPFALSDVVEHQDRGSRYSAVYNLNKKLIAIADVENRHVAYLNVLNQV